MATARPPIQAVIEEQAEFDTGRRNWRMVLFNEDGTPFTGGGGGSAGGPPVTQFDAVDADTLIIGDLDTDDTAFYELVVDGVITTAEDAQTVIRPTSGSYSSAGVLDRVYNDEGLAVQNASWTTDTGLLLFVSGWNTNNEVFATARLMLRSDGYARSDGSFTLHPDSNANRVMHGDVAGVLRVKQAIPALTIHFGGTFTGRVTIRKADAQGPQGPQGDPGEPGVSGVSLSTWQEPTDLAATFSQSGTSPLQFRKDSLNKVTLRGAAIVVSAFSWGDTLFTLPPEDAPSQKIERVVPYNETFGGGVKMSIWIEINTDGTVKLITQFGGAVSAGAGSRLVLDGVEFYTD